MKTNRIFTTLLLTLLTAMPMLAQGQKFSLNGLQIEFTSCTPYADGIVVNATFTNVAGRDVAFKVNNYFEDQCYVIDEQGDQHQLAQLIIGGQGAAGSDFRTIPQDITMKGQIYFRHVSDQDSSIKRIKLLCRVSKDGVGEQERDLVWTNLPISPLNNTNRPNTKFTDSAVTMDTKSLVIEEPNAVLRFTLTNHDRQRYDCPVRQVTAYDENGNSYEGTCDIGYMRLETDVPQAFVITIPNVPNDLKKFTVIRCMFDEWEHKMEWKNIEVETNNK